MYRPAVSETTADGPAVSYRATFDADDADRVRAQFPALADGEILLDGPSGTQMPEGVSSAIQAAMVTAVSNNGGLYQASRRGRASVDLARAAMADLLGADPRGVVLGPNMTTLTYRISRTCAEMWGPRDNIVVTRLDHDADVRPWVQAAERRGVQVRWADIDADTCELPAAQYDGLVDAHTRLVAVSGASNLAGTRPAVRVIADIAHAVNALVYIDGVALTPHTPIDVYELGADFYACSSYKFCGPHLGIVAASPDLLASLPQDKLAPATSEVPASFEWGTPPFELLAGLPATVDFLASSASQVGDAPTRRQAVLAGMAAIEHYEEELADVLRTGLESLSAVTLYGRAAQRTPTVSFRVDGRSTSEVAGELGKAGIGINHGNHYAYELVRRLGLDLGDGVLRAGMAPYNTRADVDALLEQLDRIIGTK